MILRVLKSDVFAAAGFALRNLSGVSRAGIILLLMFWGVESLPKRACLPSLVDGS